MDLKALELESLRGKRIFLSGHTGFKGSWMTALLSRVGASVYGYGLAPDSEPSLYMSAGIPALIASETLADIRNFDALSAAITAARPDLIIHMAAQAFVRRSYRDPVYNWDVNVMGTVNVLECARSVEGLAGVIVVTSDKCYENRNWEWGYREDDPLGGHDPYSASKAAAELVTQSYRKSFFDQRRIPLVTVRAGNVIGGGDWSEDRLVPDAARAAGDGKPLLVRSPKSTRPWQHVLDCLSGYLAVADRMVQSTEPLKNSYNFGPNPEDNLAVGEVLRRLQTNWPELSWDVSVSTDSTTLHEAAQLYLDSARARRQLNWRPRWRLEMALEQTARWYRMFQSDPDSAPRITMSQIEEFIS